MLGPFSKLTGNRESKVLESIVVQSDRKLLPLFAAFAAIFLVAFCACLFHNLFEPNTKTIYFADSRNYLATANHFSTMFLDALHGKSPAELMSDPSVRTRIETDGPALATLFGSVFTLIGRPVKADDWKILMAIHSTVHALTAVCVGLLVFRIVPSLRFAIPAGIAYAVFPPALIAAGRLMTETLSNFLIVSFLCTLNFSMKHRAWSLVVGLIAGASFINRVLLAPSVVACIGLLFALRKLKFLSLILIVVAFVSVIAPWTLFSASYLGRPMLTTERAGTHNAVNGWDLDQDGLQNTYGGYKEIMMSNQNPLSVIWGVIANDPQRSFVLLVKKISRLYGQPFNDFRHRCFGLNSDTIILIQWLYLFMGLFGIFLFACGGYRHFKPEPRLLALVALLYLVCMQCYFMFEANSRYGFTAFPILTVFGAVSVCLFADLLSNGLVRRALILSTATLVVTALVVSSEKLVSTMRADGELRLAKGQSAICRFYLSDKMSVPIANKEIALLLVDGDDRLDKAQVSVNDRKLGEALLPLNYLDSERFKQFNLMRECAYGLGVKVGELRQWRAAVIPREFLKIDGENTFTVTAGDDGASIYVDPDPVKRKYRDTRLTSVNRLLNSPSGYEMRPWEPVLSARVDKKFSLADGNKIQEIGSQSLRMYLAMSHRRFGCVVTPPVLKDLPFTKELHQDDFPLLMRVAKSDEVMVSKFVSANSNTGVGVKIPGFGSATHIRIRFTGEVKSNQNGLPVGIAITTADDSGMPWILPGLPFSIATSTAWTSFEETDTIPLRIYRGPVSQIAIGLYPGPWPETSGVGPSLGRGRFLFRKLKLVIEPLSSIDLAGANLSLY